jgi:hypothetical protein
LGFVAASGEACCQCQSNGKTCQAFEVAHDLEPFASVLLP